MTSKLPLKLEDLLRQRTVEGERIEYKAGWNPDPVVRMLCAFANDFENLGGGYIVIGQDCDAEGRRVFPPVGIAPGELDKIQQSLLQYCHAIEPRYFPVLSVEEFAGKTLLVLWAPAGMRRPYKAPKSVVSKHREYAYYIRRYASTIEAQGEDERDLLSLSGNVPFDDRFNREATVNDLSPRLMTEYLREVGSGLAEGAAELSIEALGRQLNVVGGPPEAPMPKNVGLLFFNEAPQRFFPVTQIDVVYFPDGAGGDRFEEKEFRGSLARITRDAIDYIVRNYQKEIVLKRPDRPEAERFWNFPEAAIEEAVVNAVYHRSYEEREPVEVRISAEDLVVLSFPGPDRSIRMEDLRAGKGVSRRYRNRRIGEFLKELELTEGRSTGVPKIFRAMKANGSPPPQFESDKGRTHFIIRLPVHLGAAPGVTGQVGTESGLSSDQVTPQVTGQVAKLLLSLDREMSRGELQDALGLVHREHFTEAYLQPAIAAGLIEMTIPDKPRSSKQRYRLSAPGRDWRERHGDEHE